MFTAFFAILPALALVSAAPSTDQRRDYVPAFKLQSGRSGNCLGYPGDKLGMVPCDSAYSWYFPKNERTSVQVQNGLTLGLRGSLVNSTPVDGIVPARGGGSTIGQSWEQLENDQIVTFDSANPDAKFCLDEADESDDNKVQIWECHDADHKDYQYQVWTRLEV